MTFPPPDIEESFTGDVVLLADASVEGEDIASMLRARGFVVVDVPLALLEARVVSEEPRVIVLDVDQPGAVDKARRVRDLAAGPSVEILCVGDPLRAAELAEVSLNENVFERPVDIPRLVDRVGALATPAGPGYSGRGTTPPPMYAPRPSTPPSPDSVPPISEIPRPDDPLEIGAFLDPIADAGVTKGLLVGPVPLSPELSQLISEAEARVRATIDRSSSKPVPSDDGDYLLPPEMLAMLDEPIDPSEDVPGTGDGTGGLGRGSSSGTSGIGPSPAAMTPVPRPITSGGEATQALKSDAYPSTTGDPQPPPSPARGVIPAVMKIGDLIGRSADATSRRSPFEAGPGAPSGALRGPVSAAASSGARAPATTDVGMALPPSGPTLGSEALLAALRAEDVLGMAPVSPPVRFREPRDIAEGRAFDLRTLPTEPPNEAAAPPLPGPTSATLRDVPGFPASREPARMGTTGGRSPAAHSVGRSRDSSSIPMVFGEGEGLRPIARAVATRVTGSLALTASGGTRRIVLQEGDLVTAGSEIADESLVAFLAGRGDLDRDAAARLAGKLPPSGRHAGAALIAQGYLSQDDLWAVLRAHAQWLVGRAMTSGPGTIEMEEEPPGRLRQEPAVFGGATGAEVFVETARRVLSPALALAALGGGGARVEQGPRLALLGECALSDEEQALVRSAAGRTMQELGAGDPEGDLVTVVRALVELEVLAVLAPARPAEEPRRERVDPLDDEAIRQRVRARVALVRDGDYFALLGVGRGATSYEIKRAYLDLRRTFEPSRLLTGPTADLYDDVKLVLEVVEEAYEILRDQNRRDRYKRAIEAAPPDG
jgi:hypothetical protein